MKKLKRIGLFVITPFLLAFTASGFLDTITNKVNNPDQLPEFEVELLGSDKTFNSKNLNGKYTLLDVWAPSCGVCVEDVPKLQKLNKKFDSENFEIVSFALSKKGKVREFLEEYPMPWKHALAERSRDGEVVQALEVRGTPTYYFVSPEGEILATNEDFEEEGSFSGVIDQYL